MLPSAHSTGSASSDCIVPSQSLSLICRGLTQLELARSQTTNRPIKVANASWATGAIVDRYLWCLISASSSTFPTQLKIASSLAMGTVLGSASGEEDYCQKQSSVSHSLQAPRSQQETQSRVLADASWARGRPRQSIRRLTPLRALEAMGVSSPRTRP